jgi:DNA-binding FadR family transcriptional regulator
LVSEIVAPPRTAADPDLPAGAVAELLDAELAAAHERPSGRIAPERELAARFGLTRTAVRRWLDDLERDGRVTRHVGRGTFVLRPADAVVEGNSSGPTDTSPAEIMAVRLLLEPQMLGLAVANATGADVAEMRRCLAASEAATTFEEFEHWDSLLHASIAQASHNRLLIKLFTVMNEARNHPLWGSAKRRSFTPERRTEYEGDHRELVAAIEDRDTAAATGVMRRHLQRIRGALLGDEA